LFLTFLEPLLEYGIKSLFKQEIHKVINQIKKIQEKIKMSSLKIFLVGLSVKYTEKEVFNYFYGMYADAVTKITLKSSKAKNSRNGCGILDISNQDVYNEILARKKFAYKGRFFFANAYLKGEKLDRFKEGILKRRVFVNCLKPSLTDSELKRVFSQYGALDSAFLIRKPDGTLSNFGYVMFKSEEDAKRAIKIGKITTKNNTIVVSPFKNKHATSKRGKTTNTRHQTSKGSANQKSRKTKPTKKHTRHPNYNPD
jgi:RNA recognition motif-containing protein